MEPTVFDVVLACVYGLPCLMVLILILFSPSEKKKNDITILRIGR